MQQIIVIAGLLPLVIASFLPRHCEEQSDEAIQNFSRLLFRVCLSLVIASRGEAIQNFLRLNSAGFLTFLCACKEILA